MDATQILEVLSSSILISKVRWNECEIYLATGSSIDEGALIREFFFDYCEGNSDAYFTLARRGEFLVDHVAEAIVVSHSHPLSFIRDLLDYTKFGYDPFCSVFTGSPLRTEKNSQENISDRRNKAVEIIESLFRETEFRIHSAFRGTVTLRLTESANPDFAADVAWMFYMDHYERDEGVVSGHLYAKSSFYQKVCDDRLLVLGSVNDPF